MQNFEIIRLIFYPKVTDFWCVCLDWSSTLCSGIQYLLYDGSWLECHCTCLKILNRRFAFDFLLVVLATYRIVTAVSRPMLRSHDPLVLRSGSHILKHATSVFLFSIFGVSNLFILEQKKIRKCNEINKRDWNLTGILPS